VDSATSKIIGLIFLVTGALILVLSAGQIETVMGRDRLNPFVNRSTYISLLTLYVYAAALSAMIAAFGVVLVLKNHSQRSLELSGYSTSARSLRSRGPSLRLSTKGCARKFLWHLSLLHR